MVDAVKSPLIIQKIENQLRISFQRQNYDYSQGGNLVSACLTFPETSLLLRKSWNYYILYSIQGNLSNIIQLGWKRLEKRVIPL